MVHLTTGQLTKLGVSDANANRVLTIASIVQVESRAKADGPKVARVLDNRLAQGIKLQLDSTVSYVTGKPGVATTAADRANPSPYNTYAHAGLPPGPISNPGLAAIDAALHPAAGSWLWFVTVNPSTGETRFETHRAAEDHRHQDLPGLVQRPRSSLPRHRVVTGPVPDVRRAGVMGSPIAHSLSPALHTAAYRSLGLTGWTYDAQEVDAAGLPAVLERLGAGVGRRVTHHAAQAGGAAPARRGQ